MLGINTHRAVKDTTGNVPKTDNWAWNPSYRWLHHQEATHTGRDSSPSPGNRALTATPRLGQHIHRSRALQQSETTKHLVVSLPFVMFFFFPPRPTNSVWARLFAHSLSLSLPPCLSPIPPCFSPLSLSLSLSLCVSVCVAFLQSKIVTHHWKFSSLQFLPKSQQHNGKATVNSFQRRTSSPCPPSP